HVHVADLTGGQSQLGVLALAGDQLDSHAGRASQLGSAAGAKLYGVDHCAQGHIAQRQVVAGFDVGVGAGLHGVSLLQASRGQDVAFGAVGIVQQRDARGPIRVVFDVCDFGRHAVLVRATEVDHPVLALVAAADVTVGDLA